MMALAMRKPCPGIDERHRLIIVLEAVGLGNHTFNVLPAVELLQQVVDFVRLERRNASFTWLAFPVGKIIHLHDCLR
ncbi:hypothetical protein D3C83_30470 [compost metagenome]